MGRTAQLEGDAAASRKAYEQAIAATREQDEQAVLSAKGVEVLRRRLAGEAVTQETSGMSKGEWREFEGVWG